MSASAQPALVLLAAGASTRLGRPKALAPLAEGPGGTPLERLLAAGSALADPRPLLVTGPDHELLRDFVQARGLALELLHNATWSAGRTGSIACAVRARPARDLCLAPVDVPLVPEAVFAALAGEWRRCGAPPRGWLGPCLEQAGVRRFGHPVLIGHALLRDLQDFPPAAPLAGLRARASPLLALPLASPEILDDLDTPADLERLRARLRGA